MNLLYPIEERTVDDLPPNYECIMKTVGGVHAIINDDSVRLFALGSASRGIPYKQWKIPLPIPHLRGLSFCPHVDVFVGVELEDSSYVC